MSNYVIYALLLVFFSIYSWGFVDANTPINSSEFLYNLSYFQRDKALVIYAFIVILLFIFYWRILEKVKKKEYNMDQIRTYIIISIAMLFFSYSGFSNDIFNYIATSKVTFLYKENPYLVMPIEIPNEPMLVYMHASNKFALYGWSWILLTAIPYFVGNGNLLLTIFSFKGFIVLFYLALIYLIWIVSKKNLWSLTFFALNPLVLLETLVSSHNDVVMMFLALLSFYYLKKKRMIISVVLLVLSVFIKYATLFLVPVYLYMCFLKIRKIKIDWQKTWLYCGISMYIIFFLSPLREEMYSWYYIWPLTFLALVKNNDILFYSSFGFSFGLSHRISPFIYTREWGGITPIVKKIVSFAPPIVMSIYYAIRKKI